MPIGDKGRSIVVDACDPATVASGSRAMPQGAVRVCLLAGCMVCVCSMQHVTCTCTCHVALLHVAAVLVDVCGMETWPRVWR